ncbi:inositol monophosphatase [Akkermansiaceae bacterium]|nr:inositol monophosphatase [Akkermansiaceae bacterium]MDB4287683.1 inositol monophosphatase [bacterium]MDA7672301.1 inositol monophosphatase [Akkermansiaceae bacterium]MDB4258467.1 inositol monophosphatase [Akkermansiaceae bacterium]MDB4267804.1 inositol monophosphatase [Akkermansiaceae bacterium]
MTELETAVHAAHEAGKLLRANFNEVKDVDEALAHDLKLALDKESQDLITDIILGQFPGHAIYGEEGLAGDQSSEHQWIVDPIDGTVNFFYGIPHFCISIAKRVNEELVLGVIYDPMVNELWTVEKGGQTLLNGNPVEVSKRTTLEESILFVGCGKDEKALNTGLERFRKGSLRARKMRMMGSAALGMAYIATGRLDAYVEARISLWDIAAGQLMIESTGGKVTLTPHEANPDVYSIVATNGKIPIEEIL